MDAASAVPASLSRPRHLLLLRGVPVKVVVGLLLVVVVAAATLILAMHSTTLSDPAHIGPVSRGQTSILQKSAAGAQYYNARSNAKTVARRGADSEFLLGKREASPIENAGPGVCEGVAERTLPTCVAMPLEGELRIAIAALPPESYARSAPPSAAAPGAPGDPAWLDVAYRAAWEFATGKYDDWVDLDLEHTPPTLAQIQDALMSIDVPDDVVRPPPDRGAPILSTERLKQAVALTRDRFARTSSMRPAFTFTSQSQRDLDRIVVAHMLTSPYARMIDLRSTTLAELRSYDMVFVPFPLIAMRDNVKMAMRFQDVMVCCSLEG